MRVALATVCLLLLGLAPAVTQQEWPVTPREQKHTLSVNVDLVNLLATVADKRGHFVTNLNKQDFRIFEDDAVQDISNFSTETDLPLNIVLAVDTSGSVRYELSFEKRAAIQFLNSTLRRDVDKAALLTFDSEINLIQDFTSDPAVLARAAQAMLAGGGTKLYEAVSLAARQGLSDRSGRRIIIVLSDGEDNCSPTPLRQAIELAQSSNVTVYAISTNWVEPWQPKRESAGDRNLKELASQTGGRAFFPKRPADLTQPFREIASELRAQYSLAYRSTNPARDGAFRRIRIEAAPKYCHVRTRAGYFAPRP